MPGMGFLTHAFTKLSFVSNASPALACAAVNTNKKAINEDFTRVTNIFVKQDDNFNTLLHQYIFMGWKNSANRSATRHSKRYTHKLWISLLTIMGKVAQSL
jgi:hypothetical protein